MTDIIRKKGLTLGDLGGYSVPVEPTLPKSRGPKANPLTALRAALEGSYNSNPTLRQQLCSQTNAGSWSGSCHWDKGFAAQTLAAYIVKNEVPGMEGVENPLAMIRHHLPQVLKEFQIDRQSLIAKAIEDGTKAKAAAEVEAKAEEVQAEAAVAAE